MPCSPYSNIDALLCLAALLQSEYGVVDDIPLNVPPHLECQTLSPHGEYFNRC